MFSSHDLYSLDLKKIKYPLNNRFLCQSEPFISENINRDIAHHLNLSFNECLV